MRRPRLILVLALLAGMALSKTARAEWTTGNLPVGFTYQFMSEGTLLRDVGGNVLVLSHMRGHGDFWLVDRVTSAGGYAPGWTADGLEIDNTTPVFRLAAAPDQHGGLLYASGATDVYLQDIVGPGSTSLIPIAATSSIESSPSVIADGTGGAFIAYDQDYAKIKLQRVASGGALAPGWPAGGRTYGTTLSGDLSTQPAMAMDDGGGVLLMWATDLIQVLRVLPNGAVDPSWYIDAPLVLSDIGPNGLAPLDYAQPTMKLIRSDATDWIAAWVEGNGRVMLQRFGLDGNPDPNWTTQEFVPAADSLGDVSFVTDGLGGLYILGRGAAGLRFQHVLAGGTIAPGFGVHPKSPLDAGAVPTPDSKLVGAINSNGGIIVAWDDMRAADRQLRARFLKADGTPDPAVSSPDRIVLLSSPEDQTYLQQLYTAHVEAAVGDTLGGAYLLWDWHTNAGSPSSTPTMTHIAPNGPAVVPPVGPLIFACGMPQPNPSVERVTLNFILPESERAALELFDAAGRHVRSLVDARLPAGDNRVSWDGRDDSGRPASPGLYWLRLRAGTHEAVRRLVRIR